MNHYCVKNWSVPARLSSAWNLHSSGSLEPENSSSNYFLTFNRGDTKYHGGLRSRELCQAPIMQVLSSHLRVCESELSSWNNFFQSCRGQGSNRGPSDKKASAKSTPPRGTHSVGFYIPIICTTQSFDSSNVCLCRNNQNSNLLSKLFLPFTVQIPFMRAAKVNIFSPKVTINKLEFWCNKKDPKWES